MRIWLQTPLVVFSLMFTSMAFARGNLSILQGTTNESTTHFTVVAPSDLRLTFEVFDRQKVKYQPTQIDKSEMAGSDWVVYKLKYEKLRDQSGYVLTLKDASGDIVDKRQFKTLNTSTRDGRLGIVSCTLKGMHIASMWETFEQPEFSPDVFFFIGDSVYLDRADLLVKRLPTSELEVWEEFVATRNVIEFYFRDELVPVFSIWDDHDSGGDGVTPGNFPLMPKVHAIYDKFFANEEIPGFIERGPGLSLNFQLFGQNIIMLDGRSFRGLDVQFPYFGNEMESWLFEKVQKGSNVLVNGNQFFGKYLAKDSFEYQYPDEFKTFVTTLRKVGNEKNAFFSFISGDIHFSELMIVESFQLGYPAYEITSSPAHSTTFPGRHVTLPNPRRVAASSTFNIVNLEFRDAREPFAATMKAVSWRGEVLFEENLLADGQRIYPRPFDEGRVRNL